MDVSFYYSDNEDICSNDKIADVLSRSGCCCSLGHAWREDNGFCEPCPDMDTGKNIYVKHNSYAIRIKNLFCL